MTHKIDEPNSSPTERPLKGAPQNCTNFRGRCDNTYIRQERLAELLATVVTHVQLSPAIADEIASALRTGDGDAAQHRRTTTRQLGQQRRDVVSKLDRGYEDFVAGRISGSCGRESLVSGATEVYVTYTSPFDLLVRGNETGEWRGRRDSNPRPLP